VDLPGVRHEGQSIQLLPELREKEGYMTMSKNLTRFYIALGVTFAAFTVIAFVLPLNRGVVFWLAYLFGVLSIGAQAYIMPRAFRQGSSVRSKFYGFPVARVGAYYVAAQLLVSLAFMALAKLAPGWVWRVELILCVVLFGVAAVGFLSTDAIRDEVERQDVKLKRDVTRMRTLQSKAASLRGQCDDAATKTALDKLSEAFRFSDPVSSDATIALEEELAGYLEEMQQALLEEDYVGMASLCEKIAPKLNERNHLCRSNK